MNYWQVKQYLANMIGGDDNSRERNRKRFIRQFAKDSDFDKFVQTLAIQMPDTNRVWGVDISHWNIPPVDLARMKNSYSMDFAIVKGCDGSLNTRYFAEHVNAAKTAGVPFGMYVWLYPNAKVSIQAQVNAWYARFVEFKPFAVFIDCEWTTYGGQAANPSAADLRMAHDLWRAKANEKAITYTAKGYADTYLKGFDWTREPLWVANYGVSEPNLPAGASGWKFWQFSSTLNGAILDPTGNAELDGNYYRGTQEQFEFEFGLEAVEPPDGGVMDKYMVVTDVVTASLNIRTSAANLGVGNDLGDFNLLRGDVVHAVESKVNANVNYIRFDALYRGGELTPMPASPTGQYWAAEAANVSAVKWLAETQFEPPVETISGVRFSGEVVFDYSDGRQEVWHVSDMPFVKGPA